MAMRYTRAAHVTAGAGRYLVAREAHVDSRVSRRRFLRGSAALAAGLALARVAPAAYAQASPGPRRPVLLVHGFGDRADVWGRSDNALTTRLVGAGYRPGLDLLPFRYPELPGLAGAEDSEGDIGAIGLALAGAIRSAAAGSPDGQVDLLAFSMGGLVSRWAINALRAADGAARGLINTAVLVAAPNAGADILLWLARLNPRGQATLVELGRELFGLDLDSVAARQMLPRSAFLDELNQPSRADDRVRYVTIAGSVRLDLRILSMRTTVDVGDGLISLASAGYLPGLAARSYLLRDDLGAGGESLIQAVRRSAVFHGGLIFNDAVGLAAAAELAPEASGLRAELEQRLGAGQLALPAPA